jgi:hypothetical protein
VASNEAGRPRHRYASRHFVTDGDSGLGTGDFRCSVSPLVPGPKSNVRYPIRFSYIRYVL